MERGGTDYRRRSVVEKGKEKGEGGGTKERLEEDKEEMEQERRTNSDEE